MDSKNLEMLEFPKVREILAGYTSFVVSRELVLSLSPSTDRERISVWLRQSAEARRLLALEPDFSIGDVFDIREPLKLSVVGKALETATLLEIRKTLVAVRIVRAKLGRLSNELPLLWNIASQIVPLPHLEEDIGGCISPAGELMDSASPKLADLRQRLKETRKHLMEHLESIIESKKTEKYIQEPLITEREGRYVIPIKIELRKEFKGIVHDVSNTGATAFVEPWSTVEMGNELREMIVEEKHEVERILLSLSSSVGADEAVISRDVALLAELDLALAKARYAEKAKAIEAQIDCTGGSAGAGVLRLVDARHPLLKGRVVPLSIEMGKDFSTLVITGPNTGGKTVALKTIGLLTLMTQAGMPIPADDKSCIPVFDGVFADIGDEQSIEQTLSTFSWHIGNIVRIIQSSTEKSLLLLDELGTSTDPAEGSALAQAILLHFLARRTMVVATTHYGDLKAFAHATQGLQNASLDFDPVTLSPTYHLTVGIPGGSNALAIASRLGLSQEIVASARDRLSHGAREVEVLLSDLMSEKQKLEALRHGLEKEKDAAVDLKSQLDDELQKLKKQEQDILREARVRLIREGDELQRLIRDSAAELKRAKSKESIEQAQKALAAMREQLQGESWQPRVSQEGTAEPGLAVGDRVWLRDTGAQGTVLSLPDASGQLEVQVGQTRLRLSEDSIEKAEASTEESPRFSMLGSSFSKKTASYELDLRGKRADEVGIELDRYLNDASLANLNEVRIIHGFGTGTVRQIVRELLSSHPLVKSFRRGERGEGGDGVTIARLK